MLNRVLINTWSTERILKKYPEIKKASVTLHKFEMANQLENFAQYPGDSPNSDALSVMNTLVKLRFSLHRSQKTTWFWDGIVTCVKLVSCRCKGRHFPPGMALISLFANLGDQDDWEGGHWGRCCHSWRVRYTSLVPYRLYVTSVYR